MEIVCVEKVLYRTMQKYGKALYGEKAKIKCDYWFYFDFVADRNQNLDELFDSSGFGIKVKFPSNILEAPCGARAIEVISYVNKSSKEDFPIANKNCIIYESPIRPSFFS